MRTAGFAISPLSSHATTPRSPLPARHKPSSRRYETSTRCKNPGDSDTLRLRSSALMNDWRMTMNNLSRKVAATVLVTLGCSALLLRPTQSHTTAAASNVTATVANPPQFGLDTPCVSNIPRSWGQYRGGSSQSGLSFEASDGTLRFVTNLPCGATPVIALEVRRTPATGVNSSN